MYYSWFLTSNVRAHFESKLYQNNNAPIQKS